MSQITLPSLPRISALDLSKLLLTNASSNLDASIPPPSNLAIIDVRDDDHVGGQICHSLHHPSLAFSSSDTAMAELVNKLSNKEIVVFHCSLSQQRGPGLALRYLREREKMNGGVGEMLMRSKAEREGGERKEGKEGEWVDVDGAQDRNGDKLEGHGEAKEQKVYVLDKGFVGWQERFGEDTRLTEGFRKELWR